MAGRRNDDYGVYIFGELYDTRVYDDDYGGRGSRYGRDTQRGASRRGFNNNDGPRLQVQIKTAFSSGVVLYFDAEEYEPIFDSHELGERVVIRARPAVSKSSGKLNWYDPEIIRWLDEESGESGSGDDIISVLQSASARGRAGADSDINDLEEV